MRPHPWLPLPLLLALRSLLGRQRGLAGITVLAVAASVALATGLEMASRGVESELDRTARELAGAADLEIAGGSAGIPEALLEAAAAVPGVRAAVPFVQARFQVDGPEDASPAIQILGVDLLADPDVRAYSGDAAIEDPLRLMAGADAVIVSRVLADRLGLATGDALPVRAGPVRLRLTVRGVLAPEGIAKAYGGQIAVMDVYTLQTLLRRQGWLDRIDVVLEEGAPAEEVRGALEAAVAGKASVRRAAARDSWVASALLAIRLVVSCLLGVAILVASLVCYSALSLFVERRRPELALLGAAGLEPRRLRRFLHLDAAWLALAGATLGLLLGRLLSERLLAALSFVSGFLQGVDLQQIELRASTVAVALGVGLGVSFAGVFFPARRAARCSPLEALTGSTAAEASRTRRGRWLSRATNALRSRLDAALPGLGRLAGASLAARPGQTALACLCVSGVVAGVALSLCLARSTGRSLDLWMAGQFEGGVFVTAGELLVADSQDVILPETLATIRATPGVVAVFDHVGEKILHHGREVLLAAGSMEVLARHGRLPAVDGDPRAVAEAVARGDIAVSEGFSRSFAVGVGDEVVLDTPRGQRAFRVAGVIRDYAGPAGSLNLDISVYDELWPRRGSRDLVFWTEGAPSPVIAEIRRRVGDAQILFFAHGDELARFASHLLEPFQALLASVALLTALLGGIAVWNVMLASVAARTRELALLRATGATGRQLRALTVIDGLLLGFFGGALGIGFGVCVGYPLVARMLAGALGWSLSFSVAPAELGLLAASLLAAAVLASLYPARVAARVPMREASSAE